MKIKIENKWYDSRTTPIMLILTEKDKQYIKDMVQGYGRIILCSEDKTTIEVLKWSKE